jgi:dolichol-phosphate mannosyltransferase
MTKLWVLVAVYNERDNIEELINSFMLLRSQVGDDFQVKIVIVDDGSTDGTTNVIKSNNKISDIECLTLRENSGPGAAFAEGFSYITERISTDDLLVTMEGDNTNRIETLMRLIIRSKEGYDVVQASPYAYGGGFSGTPWWRLLVSYCANQLTMNLLRLHGLTVYSCFFRLYSGRCILKLKSIYGSKIIELTGFEWAVEMLYKLSLIGVRISEVETKIDWNLRKGSSKMRTIKTIKGYIRVFCLAGHWKREKV